MTRHSRVSVFSEPHVVACYDRGSLHESERLLFETYLKEGMAILDVGVGAGRTTPYLSALAAHYVGIDYSHGMVVRCGEKFPTTSFLEMDASEMSAFRDYSFDAVIFSFNGIGCLPTDEAREKCLRECARVLRPAGVFILSSHNARYLFVYPILSEVSGVKKIWRLTYAMAQTSLNLFPRVMSRAFWNGSGYVFDPLAHGGIVTYVSTPDRFAAELGQAGFKVACVVGAHYPSMAPVFATPWYYYACMKDLRADGLG